MNLTNERLHDGDWTKGIAGGYGTKQTTWGDLTTDVPDLKTGFLSEKPLSWTVNAETNQATIVMQIRQGIHWALNSNSAASRKAAGREFTADDVVHSINYRTTDNKSFVWGFAPELRNLKAVKTGPWEVTLTMPVGSLLQGVQRLFDAGPIQPPELDDYNYGRDWRDSVGTGPFMLVDYVTGGSATLVRNPNYWGKDPIGPGKGNQLPYADGVKYLIIPDPSTQQAAVRTGKLDIMRQLTSEDASALRRTQPSLINEPRGTNQLGSIFMRTDLKPFSDVKVRRALMMAINFDEANKYYSGLSKIPSWPYWYEPAYVDLYLGLDDPECPATVKELYSYSPDKAKQLLADAGYPQGFKAELALQNTEVDYYSMIAQMWSKIGVDLKLNVTEPNVLNNLRLSFKYPQMISSFTSPPAAFRLLATMYGKVVNYSIVDDPVVNEAYKKVNLTAVTDMKQAMKLTKDLSKYAADQAWVIATPRYPMYTFWWPWIKNYSGESGVGYGSGDYWVRLVWVDKDLKKQMGY
jgi:peptide/nickel transport system substrate-binding protein